MPADHPLPPEPWRIVPWSRESPLPHELREDDALAVLGADQDLVALTTVPAVADLLCRLPALLRENARLRDLLIRVGHVANTAVGWTFVEPQSAGDLLESLERIDAMVRAGIPQETRLSREGRLTAAIEAAALELETPSPDDEPDWRIRLAKRLRAALEKGREE